MAGYSNNVQVFLVRHAEAVDETLELRDPHRHLTEQGRTQAKSLGDRLRWHDCEPTHIWTSPLVRAVQTAELLIAGLGWTGPVESHPALSAGADVRVLAAELKHAAPDAHVVIVGHEPGISGLGALLTGRDDFPALKKAQCARLDSHDDGPMELRWLFSYADEAPFPTARPG